jgi:ABC-type branched-subunit amino acid transport system ATPase component
MIEIEALTVRFGGVVAIDNLTATLNAPITGLIGPNGAGKTTLLNALNGFVRPSAGRIRIAAHDVRTFALHRLMPFGIRRLFQRAVVIDNLTVWNNVAAVLDNLPGTRESRHAEIASRLEFVGLANEPHRAADTLNLYERRAVELARALVGQPKLVLMDEPAAGLNDRETERLRGLIMSVPDFCGARVLLVDHDVSLIAATCAETLVLNLGRKLAHGPTDAVLADPDVLAAYLGKRG